MNFLRSLCSLVWSDLPPAKSAQNGPAPSGSLCHQWHPGGDDNADDYDDDDYSDDHASKEMSQMCPYFISF